MNDDLEKMKGGSIGYDVFTKVPWLILVILSIIISSMTLTGCTTQEAEGQQSVKFYVSTNESLGQGDIAEDFHIVLWDGADKRVDRDLENLDRLGSLLIYSQIYTGVEGQMDAFSVVLTHDTLPIEEINIYYHQGDNYYEEIRLNVLEGSTSFNTVVDKLLKTGD